MSHNSEDICDLRVVTPPLWKDLPHISIIGFVTCCIPSFGPHFGPLEVNLVSLIIQERNIDLPGTKT